MGGQPTFLSYCTFGVGNIDSTYTCNTIYGALPSGGSLTFPCSPQPLIGRYVSVTKFAGGLRMDTIILCEVIVNGFGYTSTNMPYLLL